MYPAHASDAKQASAPTAEACDVSPLDEGDADALQKRKLRRFELSELDTPTRAFDALEVTGQYVDGELVEPQSKTGEEQARPFPFRIGPYRAFKVLGRGGMGVVYLAERVDSDLDQLVALKVLPIWAQSHERTRFLQERQILARMEHPHIAHLLDGGMTDEGAPYFAMEAIEGVPLIEYVREAQLSQPERLQLFLKICNAVHYAHQRLVVHRDLKPSNILVDRSGEPKLLDFGIAKILSDNEGTLTASSMMTPAYAAPEQLLGQAVSTLTDVYSLGVLLYELLTGTRPRAGSNIAELVQTLEIVPPAPSKVLPTTPNRVMEGIHPDLDLITLTALQREPARRYPSVEAMAQDLRAFLALRPISARADSWRYRWGKWIARNPIAAISSGMSLLALCAALLVSIHMYQRANAQALKADAVKEFMLNMFSAADATGARAANISVRELLDSSFERIGSHDFVESWRGDPAILAEIQTGMASAYVNVGEFQRALDLLEAAHTFPSATASWTRAQALRGQGDLLAARAAALDGLKRAPNRGTAAKLQAELAATDADLGDFSGAEARLRTAIAQAPEQMPLLIALAGLLGESDRTREALSLLENLRIQRAGASADLAAIELLRADALESLGARDAAATSYQTARDIYTHLLGSSHPKTLLARDALAFFQLRSGEIEQAQDELEAAIADGVRVYGENHYAVATLRSSLSTLLTRAGNFEKALEYAQSALTTRARIFAANAPAVLESRNIVATILLRLNRFEQAQELMQGTISAIRTLPESMQARKLSSAESRIGDLLRTQGKYREAINVLQGIVQREDRDDSSFDLQPTLFNLVRCALSVDDIKLARHFAEHSLRLSESSRGVAAHRWTSLLSMGMVERAEGSTRARQTLEQARIAALDNGVDSPAVKTVLAELTRLR